MPVKMQPSGIIKANLGIEPNGKVHSFFTETCVRYMDKYIPYVTGDLRNIKTVGKNYVIYESPYAHAQYVGFTRGPVVNYTTPGTGPYWDRRMASVDMLQVIKEVQDFMKRGVK